MSLKIDRLQDINQLLQENINSLADDNTLLQDNVGELINEKLVLSDKVEGLSSAVVDLNSSEIETKTLVEKLTEQIQAGDDQDFHNKLEILVRQQADTQNEIGLLMERLKTLETRLKQTPASGIFTYIENEDDQSFFVQKVEEALAQGMTYAQINKYLSKNLTSDLDKILKDHPSLTKKFIRTLRKD